MGFTLGALLADVPHTRRTQIIGTGTDANLIERFDLERSRYEGPTGIVGVLHDALSRSGLPTASLWAAVPGYASQLSSPRAAFALLDRLCAMMGTPAPVGAIANQIADYDAQVDALIADDDDLVTYVRRLESMSDEITRGDPEADAIDAIDDADPERLAAEVEQFLRDHDTDG
jgi:proteasome assembly chaperone (PAC2) family protein